MLQQLKRGKNVQNRQLKHWLTENEYKEFEEKLSKAIFAYNRTEGYRRKGKRKAAKEMGQKEDVLFERLLEYVEEIITADLNLQLWFDIGVYLGADGDMALSPQSVLRVVTSRNLDVQYSGFRSLISTKKEVKIDVLERAID